MPGRFGIGAGHSPDTTYLKDPGLTKLTELIGPEDTAYYKNIGLQTFKNQAVVRSEKKV